MQIAAKLGGGQEGMPWASGLEVLASHDMVLKDTRLGRLLKIGEPAPSRCTAFVGCRRLRGEWPALARLCARPTPQALTLSHSIFSFLSAYPTSRR